MKHMFFFHGDCLSLYKLYQSSLTSISNSLFRKVVSQNFLGHFNLSRDPSLWRIFYFLINHFKNTSEILILLKMIVIGYLMTFLIWLCSLLSIFFLKGNTNQFLNHLETYYLNSSSYKNVSCWDFFFYLRGNIKFGTNK